MTGSSSSPRRLARVLFGLGVAALVAGLPMAVEFSTPEDALKGAVVLAGSGDTVAVAVPVTLMSNPLLVLERGTLRSIDATGAPADRTITKLQLDGAAFTVRTAPSGSSTPQDAREALGPLLAQLASLNVGTLAIRRSTITVHGDDKPAAVLSEISADVTSSRKEAYFAKGSASFNGQALRFEADWSRSAEGKPLTKLPLRLTIRSTHLDAIFDGRLSLADGAKLQGTADIHVRKVRAFARWFGLPVPGANDLREARLNGPLEWGDGSIALPRTSVVVDGNPGEGALSLKLRGARPSLEGTVAFKSFDLSPYIAALMAPTPSGLPLATASNPGEPVNASLLLAIDADLRLSAAKVIAPHFETGRGAVTIALKHGRLLADLAELEIEGGSAGGQITIDANGQKPRLGIKGKLAGVDPGRVFADGLKRNPLFGRATIGLDGFGVGPTLPEIISSFAGKGQFSLIEPGRLGLDLRALAYSAQDSNHVGWLAAGKGPTPLDQLEARFQLSNGALTLDTLEARSGPQSYVGAGKVDLVGRLLDMQLALGVAAASETPITAQKVLVFRGPWADPAISLLGRPFTTTAPAVKGATMIPAPVPAASR